MSVYLYHVCWTWRDDCSRLPINMRVACVRGDATHKGFSRTLCICHTYSPLRGGIPNVTDKSENLNNLPVLRTH